MNMAASAPASHARFAAVREPRVVLVSRLNYPVVVKYGNESLRLSPRGLTRPLVKRLLGDLPAGVSAVALH
jgi:hypothetical protein